jgi:hypothetical protein
MMKFFLAALSLGLLTPVLATAQSNIDGTWKIDLNKAQMPTKPDVFLLQHGTYQCKTCVPAFEVTADGQDHMVTGHPYYNSVAIVVVDDHTIRQTNKKDGKVVSRSQTTVSPDGTSATLEFADSSATNAEPVSGNVTMSRVDKGPAGSHAISGSWRSSTINNVSDNGLLFTYTVEGDSISMATPTGQSFTAKLDGTDAPYKGDPGQTSISMRKTGDNTIEETDKREGKVISVAEITVAPDGKTMTIAISDKLRGTESSFVAEKQP